MNANVSKTNTGKLLAAVLVMAMVIAGAAVVFSEESVDAATSTASIEETLNPLTDAAISAGNYYAAGEITATISSGNVNIYLVNGAKVTFAVTGSPTITVYAATNGSAGTAPTEYVKDLSITAIDGITVENNNGALVKSGTGDVTAIAGISAKTAQSITYYGKGASQSISLSENGITKVTVTNGTATVSQGNNSVTITETSGTATVAYGANGIPAVTGEATTDITLESGVIGSASGTLTASDKFKDYVELTAGSKYYYSTQVLTSVGTPSETVTAAEINGNIAQRSSVGDSKMFTAEPEVTFTITVAASSNYTINNNVNVYATSLSADGSTNGTVSIFGSLYVKTTSSVSGVLGPSGYYEGITFTGSNSNVTSATAEDFEITGEPSSDSVGDAIIKAPASGTNTLTIPEGTTFTVKGNFGLNGQQLVVKGTLVIENRGSIYGTGGQDEAIVLEGKGSIQNNGAIGKMLPVKISYTNAESVTQSISMQGVSGVSFGIDKTVGLTVTGNVTATSGAKANNLTIDGAVITGDFTTASKVTLNIPCEDNTQVIVNVMKNAAVVLNGKVVIDKGKSATSPSAAIALAEGSSISVNGAVDAGISITAAVGMFEGNNAPTGTNVEIKEITDVAGFTMYVKKVAVADENDSTKTNYYLRAYVNGNLALADKADEGSISITGVAGEAGDVSKYVYIASGETLNIGKGVDATINYVVFEGTAVFSSDAGKDSAVPTFIGATYGIDATGENNQTLTTKYYTNLAAAMDKIADVNEYGITAYVNDLDMNVTVADGQYLILNVAGTISQDAVLTVENGATLEGTIQKVDGKMIIEPEVVSSSTPVNYDVMSTSEDGTVTYAGIAVAIAEAQPGDKITVGSAEIGSSTSKQSLTIPQGVEVTVTESLTVYGDLTVANEATLVGGTINMARADSKVTVNGTLNLSEGNFIGYDNFTLTSNGTTVVSAIDAELDYNGARYAGEDGTVITTVANAVAYAVENEITTPVAIHGTVSNTADLVLDGVGIALDENAKVTLGNVTLTGAVIDADATGAELTAVVTALNGEGDAAANGTVSVNKSNIVIESTEVVNAAGTTVYTYTIDDISGTMTVQSGTVVIDGTVATADKSKFTVASGATLLVTKGGDLTVGGIDVEFTVAGTMNVDEGEVKFQSGKNVIDGTVDISGNGAVEAAALVINGTVNVSATENDEGNFTVTGKGVTVGDVKEALGATGSIVGIIGFDADMYVIAYAGTDMSGAKLANDAEFETTAFYFNDALYATVYAATGVTSPITEQMIRDIPGIAKSGDLEYTDANGEKITVSTIGQYEAVYIEAPLAEVNIKVSVGTGISLYIDNVKVETGDSFTIGTHTVYATVNPGYVGEVTITFDGQTVTGGSFEITVDSEGAVLSALGDISVDTGSTSGGDSGMGLTEILLVILVILIVVMAIMVALRLMRS